ncbi:MAG: uracil phosphoribosyltransferase [Butyricicoccus sp.]
MAQVHVMDHPLILHKLSLMRDRQTGAKEFREAAREIAMLMCYEATRDLPLKEISLETPLAHTRARVITGKKIAFVPVMRTGLGMVEGMLELIPAAKVGHIGLFRDPETMQAVEYYCKLPVDIAERDVIIIDPMIATGASASAAVNSLKERGVRHIKLLCLLMTEQAVELLQREHPDVEIFTAAVDPALDENGFILPGMGDAGDRLFGTR